MSLNEIKRKSFWFTRAKVDNKKHWPFGSSRYVEDLSRTIPADFYGQSFQNAKNCTEAQYRRVLKEPVILQNLRDGFSPEEREAFSLLTNGFTTNTILGKLRDAEINQAAVKPKLAVNANVTMSDADTWAQVSSDEPVFTPREFVNLARAERIANNTRILTEHQSAPTFDANLGYLPPKLENGRDFSAFANMDNIENFDKFVADLEKNAGIRIRADETLNENETKLTKRKFYGPLSTIRKVFTTSAYSTGIKKTGWPTRFTLAYPANNTQAESTYAIIKRLSQIPVEDYVDVTRNTIALTEPTNLPSMQDFERDKDLITKAATCLVASDLSHMIGLEKNDAKLFSDTFKLEATEYLSQLQDQDSKTIMPLIADYYAIAISNFVQDFNVSINQYAESKGVNTANAYNIYDVLYARQAPQVTVTSTATFNEEEYARAMEAFLNPSMQRQQAVSTENQATPQQPTQTQPEQEQVQGAQEQVQQNSLPQGSSAIPLPPASLPKEEAENYVMPQKGEYVTDTILMPNGEPAQINSQLYPYIKVVRDGKLVPIDKNTKLYFIGSDDSNKMAVVNGIVHDVVENYKYDLVDNETGEIVVPTDDTVITPNMSARPTTADYMRYSPYKDYLRQNIELTEGDIFIDRNAYLMSLGNEDYSKPNIDYFSNTSAAYEGDLDNVIQMLASGHRVNVYVPYEREFQPTPITREDEREVLGIDKDHKPEITTDRDQIRKEFPNVWVGDPIQTEFEYHAPRKQNEENEENNDKQLEPEETTQSEQTQQQVQDTEQQSQSQLHQDTDRMKEMLNKISRGKQPQPVDNQENLEENQEITLENTDARQAELNGARRYFEGLNQYQQTSNTGLENSVQEEVQNTTQNNLVSPAGENYMGEVSNFMDNFNKYREQKAQETASINEEEWKKDREMARKRKYQQRKLAELQRNRKDYQSTNSSAEVVDENQNADIFAQIEQRATELGRRKYKEREMQTIYEEFDKRAADLGREQYNQRRVQQAFNQDLENAPQEVKDILDYYSPEVRARVNQYQQPVQESEYSGLSDPSPNLYNSMPDSVKRRNHPEIYYAPENLQARLYGNQNDVEQTMESSEQVQEPIQIEDSTQNYVEQETQVFKPKKSDYVEFAGQTPDSLSDEKSRFRTNNQTFRACQQIVTNIVDEYTTQCRKVWENTSRTNSKKMSDEQVRESEEYRTKARTGGIVKNIMDGVIKGEKPVSNKNIVERAVAKELLQIGHDIARQIDAYGENNPSRINKDAHTEKMKLDKTSLRGYLRSLANVYSAYAGLNDKQKEEVGRQVLENSLREDVYRILDAGSGAVIAKKEQDLKNAKDKEQIRKIKEQEKEKDKVLQDKQTQTNLDDFQDDLQSQ